jgi:hypothetical protein
MAVPMLAAAPLIILVSRKAAEWKRCLEKHLSDTAAFLICMKLNFLICMKLNFLISANNFAFEMLEISLINDLQLNV